MMTSVRVLFVSTDMSDVAQVIDAPANAQPYMAMRCVETVQCP